MLLEMASGTLVPQRLGPRSIEGVTRYPDLLRVLIPWDVFVFSQGEALDGNAIYFVCSARIFIWRKRILKKERYARLPVSMFSSRSVAATGRPDTR